MLTPSFSIPFLYLVLTPSHPRYWLLGYLFFCFCPANIFLSLCPASASHSCFGSQSALWYPRVLFLQMSILLHSNGLIVFLHLQDSSHAMSSNQTSQNSFIDYISFQIPEESFPEIANCIGIARGFMNDLISVKKGYSSLEAVLLGVPDGYHCVDLSLYKVKTLI